ncbi:hypothetical protein MRY87_00900 [bacterium]|nr:hypothetical protein [bacterium]
MNFSTLPNDDSGTLFLGENDLESSKIFGAYTVIRKEYGIVPTIWQSPSTMIPTLQLPNGNRYTSFWNILLVLDRQLPDSPLTQSSPDELSKLFDEMERCEQRSFPVLEAALNTSRGVAPRAVESRFTALLQWCWSSARRREAIQQRARLDYLGLHAASTEQVIRDLEHRIGILEKESSFPSKIGCGVLSEVLAWFQRGKGAR